MDFIETLLGIAPDNGDGSLETMLIVAISLIIAVFAFRRRIFGSLLRNKTSTLCRRMSLPSVTLRR
ncbi:hypothetical protein O7A70_32690 [Mesorhizobium sp. Cs1299R1N1]|uniref:hypothetical protein n=1 Tax=Mesorhizobium sp. Cs1299R1N1 TaxID=3015172 RepID=UPI00301D2FD5